MQIYKNALGVVSSFKFHVSIHRPRNELVGQQAVEVKAIKSMYGQQFHHVLVYINVLFPRKEILLLSKHSAVLVSALKP